MSVPWVQSQVDTGTRLLGCKYVRPSNVKSGGRFG